MEMADDLTRRSFLKASSGRNCYSFSKVPAVTETDQNSQRTNPVSGSQSDDLTKLSIREAADLIRKKKVSPVDLTKACLARIDRVNPSLNAFITITENRHLSRRA